MPKRAPLKTALIAFDVIRQIDVLTRSTLLLKITCPYEAWPAVETYTLRARLNDRLWHSGNVGDYVTAAHAFPGSLRIQAPAEGHCFFSVYLDAGRHERQKTISLRASWLGEPKLAGRFEIGLNGWLVSSNLYAIMDEGLPLQIDYLNGNVSDTQKALLGFGAA